MRNQIMSTFLIGLLVALSFFGSDGGLGLVEAQQVAKCQAQIPIDVCTVPHCSSLCDEKYSNDLGVAEGTCLSQTVCNCSYLSINPDCHV
ncbi:hypothetical protein PIB30_043832 [Stylosanthes scabra]|uniref:Uncharacterized protein n=1 Tax=Stylosanthes scabra TaxID=79078 RepID=A0ABU6WE68_9FABA|nr:hypothetical protein [Stylosanthes scabra]